MSILRLSECKNFPASVDHVLLMVGSYAPVHLGHIDTMNAAKKTLEHGDEHVSSIVLSPNSDSYVAIKLQDETGRWSFNNRLSEFKKLSNPFSIPMFVDDISGVIPPERSITETAIGNIKKALGVKASQIVLVVGSDQAYSVEPHLKSNRAMCVIRPGEEAQLLKLRDADEEWFSKAVLSGQYTISDQANPNIKISSTELRNYMKQLAVFESL